MFTVKESYLGRSPPRSSHAESCAPRLFCLELSVGRITRHFIFTTQMHCGRMRMQHTNNLWRANAGIVAMDSTLESLGTNKQERPMYSAQKITRAYRHVENAVEVHELLRLEFRVVFPAAALAANARAPVRTTPRQGMGCDQEMRTCNTHTSLGSPRF